jgi:WD40 repeat protein
VVSGREIAVLRGHTASVTTLAFSRTGGVLATGGNDEAVQVRDTATWSPPAELTGHTAAVNAVAFGDDRGHPAHGSRTASVHHTSQSAHGQSDCGTPWLSKSDTSSIHLGSSVEHLT